mgnify:CR=1 FL=1
MVLEWGLKDNYKDFKENFYRRFGGNFSYTSPFLAYNSDDTDMAYAFHNEYDLKAFLEHVWYEDNYSDHSDMENSMSEWRVWKFVDEEDIKNWPILYPKVKQTSIVCEGKKVYRQLHEIKIEACINVNVDRKL